MGLVNRVVPHDQLLAVALGLAADVVSANQPATRALVAVYAGFSGAGPRHCGPRWRPPRPFWAGGSIRPSLKPAAWPSWSAADSSGAKRFRGSS